MQMDYYINKKKTIKIVKKIYKKNLEYKIR